MVDLLGDIQLIKPARMYWLLEERGVLPHEVQQPKNVVKRVFLGMSLPWTLQNPSFRYARSFVDKHALKKRKYIGPTSMDHELSLLMANLAKVSPTTVVCDPFVGTASVLVACSEFGATCVGGGMNHIFIQDTRYCIMVVK
jgi:tRNA (guanine10-N2)-methyltransferase